MSDYRDTLTNIAVPVVSHEVGQDYVTPNFDEIKKYTGVLKPRNLEQYREDAVKFGTIDKNQQFALASAKLAAVHYRDEIERQLRTPHYGGFQLLDLHDYPGQGTALIGLLDSFWDSKGAIQPDEFRQFCGPVVPLARLEKRTFKNSDQLKFSIDLANYGEQAHTKVAAKVILRSGDKILQEQELPAVTSNRGDLTTLGTATFDLKEIKEAQKLTIEIKVPELKVTNSYSIWVYPDDAIQAGDVVETSEWNQALQSLKAGKKVLWLTSGLPGLSASKFQLPFWTPSWNSMRERFCGIFVDPKHPLFQKFPTDFYADWQWYDPLTGGGIMNLNALPHVEPIVTVIDSPLFGQRQAAVFEGKIGSGKLLVCSLNLAPDHPSASSQEFQQALLSYMDSSEFKPTLELPENLPDLIRTAPKGNIKALGGKIVHAPGEAARGADVTQIALGSDASKDPQIRQANRIIDGTVNSSATISQPSGFPYEIVIGFPKPQSFSGFELAQRSFDGREVSKDSVKSLAIYASDHDGDWGSPIFRGSLNSEKSFEQKQFSKPKEAQFFKIVLLESFGDPKVVSLSEFDLVP